MNVALVVITDGRGKYLEQTIPSFRAACKFKFATTILVDDSADAKHHYRACELVNPDRSVMHTRKRGGAEAIRSAWRTLEDVDVDYVFHLEDDWTFPFMVPVEQMIAVLEADSGLANCVLRRQSWGMEPIGGYIAADPYAFTNRSVSFRRGTVDYLEHRKGFWLNPCVYPAHVTQYGWPAGGHEHDFTARLRADDYSFAVYGTHTDAPRCLHIGRERTASWTW